MSKQDVPERRICRCGFIVDDTRIPAHKMILSARCAYFNAMFQDGFVEKNKNEIKLEGIPLDGFIAILKLNFQIKFSSEHCAIFRCYTQNRNTLILCFFISC